MHAVIFNLSPFNLFSLQICLPPGSTLDAIESFIQQERANMIIPTPTRERPRIRGRMTPYAFFVQERRDYYRQQGVPVQFTAFSKECSSLWKVYSHAGSQSLPFFHFSSPSLPPSLPPSLLSLPFSLPLWFHHGGYAFICLPPLGDQ